MIEYWREKDQTAVTLLENLRKYIAEENIWMAAVDRRQGKAGFYGPADKISMEKLRVYNQNADIYLEINDPRVVAIDDLCYENMEKFKDQGAGGIIRTSQGNYHAIMVFDKELSLEQLRGLVKQWCGDPSHLN